MAKRRNTVLIITEISLLAVVTLVMSLTIAYLRPAAHIKHALRMIMPFLIIIYFFLFLTFRILNFYYLQLLHQKNLVEKLNSSFIAMRSSLNIDELLKQSITNLMNFCTCSRGLLLVVDENIKKYATEKLITINIKPLPENKINKHHHTLTFFPSHITQDIDREIQKLINEYDFTGCKAIVTIPFANKEQVEVVSVIGMTTMSDRKVKKMFNDIKSIIDIFIRKVNIEIENSLLHEEVNQASIIDPLTNLYNRRYFHKHVKEEFGKAKRINFPVSIMISDLDNFKNYVDIYGHPTGDLLLAEVSALIKSTMRESDTVCRFGGDEFAYLLPFTTSSEANALAERIRNTVSQYIFLKDKIEQPVHLTLSIGIATFPEHGQNEDDILAKADSMLFLSKANGKNMVTIYREKEV